MKKGIRKTISVIAILTMTFQMGMPLVPGVTSKVFATNTTIPVATEKLQSTVSEDATTDLSESTDTAETEEISRNYEIKDEETWDVSANGDGSVIAKWTLDDKTLTISGTGEMKDWDNDSVEGWHDTQYTNLIQKVIIEEGITRIGEYAFDVCSTLTSINIPESVTSIDAFAFEGCSSLTSIMIPEGVTSIGGYAFAWCSSLESIEIPEGVTSIGYSAFYECSSLTSINIPESVTTIKNYAFAGCSSLKSITIPENVTSVGSGTFSGCSSLEGIHVDENNTEYISENGILFNKEKTEIICYPVGKKDIKEYMIPESVTSIGYCTFEGCSSLKSVDIPEGVTRIGWGAFEGCSSLISVNIPEGVTSIGSNAFDGCDSLVIYVKADTEGHRYVEENKKGYILEGEATNIDTTYRIQEEETWDISINQDGSIIAQWTLSDKTLTISGTGEMKDWDYDSVEGWHDTQYTNVLEKVIINEGIINIGEYAFEECSSLESINIPEGVTSIGYHSFQGCNSLESIKIPESVTSIENYAFYECSSLESINIPEGVKSIESDVFYGCSSLESIVIPESVTSISNGTFSGCSSLEGIHVDENNTEYISENGILFNKEKTEIICYPAGKKDIKEYMIPEGVTSIGSSVFRGCSSLASINIPEGVTSIEDFAFHGCSSLTSINIPETVTGMGIYVFYGCSSLTSIHIPEGVTSIGSRAFEECSSLISITIPESVTSIGQDAFLGCNSLQSIEIPEGVTSIGYHAFEGCNSLESIKIPESVTSIVSKAIPESTIIYTKSNSEGHRYAEEGEQGYIIDDIAPTVTFTPNAGENIQKQYSVTVEVQDDMEEVGVNENSLKYHWTQSEQQPTKESFTESFENGQAIIKNTGDGAWYLWIYAEDNVGNETITRSEAFHFDNTAPNVNVEYSTKNPTKENVTVTITSNEEMQTVQGWTLSSDKKTLTKEYSENTTETITIKDLVGNETKVDIEINNIIIIGDINQDGRIDITDFLMLKRHLVAGNKTEWILTENSLEAADMNENGTVDITDMLMLKRVVVENM